MKLEFGSEKRSKSFGTSAKNILKLPSIDESFEHVKRFLENSSITELRRRRKSKLSNSLLEEKNEEFSSRFSSIKTGNISTQRDASVEGLNSGRISLDVFLTNIGSNTPQDCETDFTLRYISAKQVKKKLKSLLIEDDQIRSSSLPLKQKISSFNRQKQSEKFLLNYLEKFIEDEDIILFLEKSKYFKLLKFTYQNQEHFLKSLANKDLEGFEFYLFRCLDLIQQANDLELFSRFIFFMGEYLREIDSKDKAVFMLQQCLIVCEYSQFYKLKCQVLQELSLLAKTFKMYEESLELVQKSLQYAWHSNQKELEIKAYDMIGQCYFYKGDMAKASLYHNRWVIAEIEPSNGFFRLTSAKMINTYERILKFKTEQFSKKIMAQLSLPITNHYETPPVQCDRNKIIKYKQCNGIQLINIIMSSFEFTDLKLEHYFIPKQYQSKKIMNRYLNHRQINHETLPRRVREIQQRQAAKFPSQPFDKSKLKVDLNIRIKERLMQAQIDLPTLQEKIKNKMGRHEDKFGERKDVIYMRHVVQQKKGVEEQEQVCLKFYKQFKKIIDKLIGDAQKKI